jgi:hypothetical protein
VKLGPLEGRIYHKNTEHMEVECVKRDILISGRKSKLENKK